MSNPVNPVKLRHETHRTLNYPSSFSNSGYGPGPAKAARYVARGRVRRPLQPRLRRSAQTFSEDDRTRSGSSGGCAVLRVESVATAVEPGVGTQGNALQRGRV